MLITLLKGLKKPVFDLLKRWNSFQPYQKPPFSEKNTTFCIFGLSSFFLRFFIVFSGLYRVFGIDIIPLLE